MEGTVWEWMATSDRLPALKQQLLVSGTIRRDGGHAGAGGLRGQPAPEAQPVTPNLEDVYLYQVSHTREARP